MSAYRKHLMLALIAAFALAMALIDMRHAAGVLVIVFLLYLVFGDGE